MLGLLFAFLLLSPLGVIIVRMAPLPLSCSTLICVTTWLPLCSSVIFPSPIMLTHARFYLDDWYPSLSPPASPRLPATRLLLQAKLDSSLCFPLYSSASPQTPFSVTHACVFHPSNQYLCSARMHHLIDTLDRDPLPSSSSTPSCPLTCPCSVTILYPLTSPSQPPPIPTPHSPAVALN